MVNTTKETTPVKKETGQKTSENKYFYGLGRRKRAIAQVRLYPQNSGDKQGTITVNQKPFINFFDTKEQQSMATRPLDLVKMLDRFFVSIQVRGGGKNGQSAAVSLGIARALLEYDKELRKQLKVAGLLTRDAREKERKKYGLVKARKAHQYTKR